METNASHQQFLRQVCKCTLPFGTGDTSFMQTFSRASFSLAHQQSRALTSVCCCIVCLSSLSLAPSSISLRIVTSSSLSVCLSFMPSNTLPPLCRRFIALTCCFCAKATLSVCPSAGVSACICSVCFCVC